MPVRARYGQADGNTVPYPAAFEGLQNNYGFIDTRGRPDQVAEILEARKSDALTEVLRVLAAPASRFFSLGCDLGGRTKPKNRTATREWAGGYVQLATTASFNSAREAGTLREVAQAIAAELNEAAGADYWDVSFILTPVRMNFEEERWAQSVWIWFDAKAPTRASASASRERLLRAVGKAITDANRSTD